MRPVKLRMKNVGPFGEAEIDFAAVPGSIIAISGRTGQGKTMTIESIFAAHHRSFPSRPDSIYKYCRGKDAQIELEFTNKGIPYRALLNIDAPGAEMEPHLFQGDVPLNDGKNKTFKKVIERLFGSDSLILSSSFSAQNHKGAFTTLAKTERKSLFIAMIGQNILEQICSGAKDKGKACDDEYESLAIKRDNLKEILRRTIPDRIALEERIRLATTELVESDAALKEKIGYLAMEKAKIEAGAGAGERKKSMLAKKYHIETQIKTATLNRENSLKLAASLDGLRLQAEGIDKEAADVQTLRTQIEEWRTDISEQDSMENEYLKESKQLQDEISGHQREGSVAKTKLDRAERDVKIIKVVPCKAEGDYAKCQFLVNAVEGRDSIDPLTGTIDSCRARCIALTEQVSGMTKPTSTVKDALRKRIAEATAKIGALESSIRLKREAQGKISGAEVAAGNLFHYEKQLETSKAELGELETEIAKIEAEEKEIEIKTRAVKSIQSQVEMQEELVSSIRDRIATSEKELSQADLLQQQFDAAKQGLSPVEESIARANRDRRSWDLLTKAFGKNGIQSLEIDVAGPEVSKIANDLLFSCFGPRFSLKFRTQKPLADGSGFQDDFDIYVHDEDRVEWCSIDDLSGGEKVIVGEAASLAIALYNRQKSSVGWETIFRDEPSSALDDENAPRYVQMLRKARELGHFTILYLISHQDSVKECCDSRINISSGQISIQA